MGQALDFALLQKDQTGENPSSTRRVGELRFITRGPRGASALKAWAPSSGAALLILQVQLA